MEFEEQLATAMRASVETLTPPVTDLVSGGVARGQRRRRQRFALAAVSAVVAVTLVGAGTMIVSRLGNDTSSIVTPASSCSSEVLTGVLPSWARDGFSDPEPAVPHVLSTKGNMVAILFGAKLYAPPSTEVNNKILWVTRPINGGSGTLFIDAVRAGTTTHVHREVPGGPGPSTIDLPKPGCWHLKLRWGTQRDTIDLVYQRP